MIRLLSDIPAYKQQKQTAKRLFREMQMEEVSKLIHLLPGIVVAHYRPVEDDFWLSVKNKLCHFWEQFKKKWPLSHKRNVRIIRSRIMYQVIVWRQLREGIFEYLSRIAAGKNVKKVYFQQILRPLELDAFMCVEQAVQVAFLESLRYFDAEALSRIHQYTEAFDIEQSETVPPYLFELKRALQWTFALRTEWDLLKHKERCEPELPLESNAELIFR